MSKMLAGRQGAGEGAKTAVAIPTYLPII